MTPSAAHSTKDRLSLTEREMLYRLRWFTRIRWVMGAFAILLLLASWHLLGVRFRAADGSAGLAPAIRAACIIFVYNAVFTVLIRHLRNIPVHRRQITVLTLGQIFCDMMAVCALVHYSGGIENYFLVLILLPLVIATELLPQVMAYATAAVAVLMISTLAWGEQSGAFRHLQVVWPGGRAGGTAYFDPYYVLEVLTALTVSIFAIVFVASSISRRLRHREFQLDDAYRRLAQADETKSFFMRKAGHEMRAPLAAIHSILDAISAHDNLPREQQLDLIARSKVRLQALMGLVDDLRRYSRLRSDQAKLALHPVRLDHVAAAVLDLFQPQARQKGVDLAGQIQDIELPADEELLREVVTNLVANALQYTPSGGRIDLELLRDGQEAILRVSDTGIGISQEAKGRVFEEFFRSQEARQFFPQGTGLGLAICKRIIDMHAGTIEIAGRDGGGTVFTIRLPLKAPSGAQASAGSPYGTD